jgi:sugar lactone lactonase YvrE
MSKPQSIPLSALEPVGAGLHRPECVVLDRAGHIYVPDWRGGVTGISPAGTQQTWLAGASTIELRPNGIDLAADGSFLLANLGDAGGVWQLRRDGALEPFLTEVDGVPIPPSNFVVIDGPRTWISVSTRQVPRQRAWRRDFADGFIVLADARGARIVADAIGYTNEVKPDPTGTWLYVVETFGRRLTRFRIAPGGDLFDRETVATFGEGCFPDGFAFDRGGAIWITCLVSNRLLRLQDGSIETVLEDVNGEFVKTVEGAFARGEMQRDHLGPISGTMLQQLTSLAFGGADGRTVYLGSLHGTCLYRFRLEASAR